VVCAPCAADTEVIRHGETGYFAHSDEEWYRCLRELIVNPNLRERVGTAARKYVCDHLNVRRITQKYIDFFEIACAQHSRTAA